jgi:hypothetical protein
VEDTGALCEVLITLVLVVRVAREGEEGKILWGLYSYNFGLGSSSALLPPGSTATSLADASGLLYYF